MASYTAEPIPGLIFKTLLDENWDELEGNIPKPRIIELISDEALRQEFRKKDVIAVRSDFGGEVETLRNAWEYKDIKFKNNGPSR